MASVETLSSAAPSGAGSPGGRSSRSLKREVGLIGLTWASVGSIIGSGWLYGAQQAVVVAGPAATVSWIIGAVAIVLLALVHAELGGMFPVAGGTARYPHYAFGGFAGMSFGWFSWLQAATVAPIEVEAMIGYAGHFGFAKSWQNANGTLTHTGFAVALVLMAVFVAVNFLGVRALARVNSSATWWKIFVPLLAIFVISAGHFELSNFTSHGFAPFGLKGMLAAISTSGIIFALLGFEQAIQLAGESKSPQRDIPRAVLGSVAIGGAVYLLLQFSYIGALPGTSFVKGWANLTYQGIEGPWAGLASLLGLGWLAWVLWIDAIVSPGGTGLIYTTSTSRISFGLARNGYVPQLFARNTERGVPWLGLATSFVAGVVCFLPFPSWQKLVGFITSASVLMYAGAPLAFGALRKRLPEAARPYRLPLGGVISPLSFAVAGLIIYWAGWDTLKNLGYAVLIGYALLGGYAVFAHLTEKPHAPRMQFKSALWLPVYLVGIGVISSLGGFGGSGKVGLGWDMALVAGFSLVIYYWAVNTALSAEDITANIAAVEVVDEGGH